MVHFVGAGPGAPDLITLRGLRLLQEADVIIYAGSLVNPALLLQAREDCAVYDSSRMTLEEVMEVLKGAREKGQECVRLHTGDPSIYGAIREQMDALDEEGIPYDLTPGVSSFSGAAAALGLEYTLPGVSQTVILTRLSGRTPVPEGESLSSLAKHGATLVIFLSTGMAGRVREELLLGGTAPGTPAALVYKATWPEQKVVRCTVDTLEQAAKENGLTKTALILVGETLSQSGYGRSCLYDPAFPTEFRKGTQ